MANPRKDNKQAGWVKIYRSLLENGWLKNHKLLIFWIYCLLKASHKPQKVILSNQQIELLPGQFIFGRKKAAKETRLSERSIRTCVYNLCTLGNLTIKTTNKYSIVTIVNWELYQGNEDKTTSKPTSNRPATDHIQEYKNVRKKNKVDFNLVIQDTLFISQLQEIYPSVDIQAQIPDMKAWLLTNPAKEDYYAFVRNWIKKANNGGSPQTSYPDDPIDRLKKQMGVTI